MPFTQVAMLKKLFASSNTTFVMETEKDSHNKEDRVW